MKPRVCVVAASEMTVRTFLRAPLVALQEQYDLTIVVNTSNPELLRDLGVTGVLRPLGIQRAIALPSDLRSFVSLLQLMSAGRFDLVQSMTPKAGLLAMVAAWLTRVPARVHTFTGQVWATRGGFSRAFLKSLDRIVAHCATFTLADSPSQREFLISQGVAPASTLAVLGSGSVSGIDPDRFRPDAERRRNVRERLGIAPNDTVILFIGRLNPDKGILDLARAFVALAREQPDIRLLVVGPDEQQMRPAIQAICDAHVERLHLLEFTRSPEEVMAAADILSLPSYREGFGNVIIEAAAAGLPAVASRIYGVVDGIVEEQTGLLHDPGDVEGLLTQLRRLTSDPVLRRHLGEAARLRAEREFSERRVTAALLELYARLIAGRPSREQATGGASSASPVSVRALTDTGGCRE